MNKISIIIPIYNTVDYLERCLTSVCNQTYRNLEIICIDDGSTDGSEKILDRYAQKDNRIIAIHQINAGESNARNTGLKIMSGECVAFLDCDDWIELDMYEILIKKMEEENVDLVASSWFKDTNAYSIAIKNEFLVGEETFGREQLLLYLYKRDSYRGFTYMWNKLYKRKLFFDKNKKLILFDEELELGGDVLYLARLALNTKNACYVDKSYYHYFQRNDSGCHTTNLKKRLDWIKAYIKIIDYINKEKINTESLLWIKRFLAYHCSNVAELAYEQKEAVVLKQCQNIMREYQKEYIQTNLQYNDRLLRFQKLMEHKL